MERKATIKVVLLNLLVMLGITMIFRASQHNAADIYMEYVVSTKATENVLFFSNFLYGTLLSGLYNLLPQISWYGVTQYACVLVSFVIITYKLAMHFKGKAGMVIDIILLITFGFECYYHPEYTKTALLVTVSALLIILQNGQKRSVFAYVFGSVWAILGALINIRVFFLALLLIVLLTGFGMAIERQNGILTVCLNLFLVVAVVCVMQIADEKQYASFHVENTAERSAVVTLYDFGWPEYALHGAEYGSLNITEDMYESLRDGRFVMINWSQIQNLAGIKAAHPYGMRNVLQKENLFQMLTASANYALLAVLAVFLFSDTKKKMLKLVWAFMMFSGSIFVAYYFGAEACGWILYAIAFVVSVALLFQTEEVEYEKLRYHLYPLLGLAFYFFFLNNPITYIGVGEWKALKEDWIAQRGANVEAQYIFDLKSFAGSKPVFISYADLDIPENTYVVSYLDYLNVPEKEHAFSLSELCRYSSNSYWCEDLMSIYAISNTVRLTEGHNVGFVEMSRAESVIIFGVNVQ